jgi:hypothetical protein
VWKPYHWADKCVDRNKSRYASIKGRLWKTMRSMFVDQLMIEEVVNEEDVKKAEKFVHL